MHSPLKFLIVSLCIVKSSFVLAEDTYAPWLTQIGLTEDVASAAKWGRKIKLGVVDTGIDATSPFFSKNQVSKKLSSCAAVTFECSNGYYDDHGHGTAVAAIAAGRYLFPWESHYGGYTVSANSIVSVAPSANIIAQKVLNASGAGYTVDVANGIIKAADAGSSVINVSITYNNADSIVSAINYAASKGAYIVWAGGNSAVNLLQGASTNGLSSIALNHLVFAGSVDAENVLSSFSNTPGSGSLNTSDSSVGYAQRWLMAPGENILSAYNPSEPYAWGYWSGTSMSAPLVSGSLVLLQSAWPILKTNGTAIDLLLSTATDLGDEGVDSTYGNGLVNLTKAFEPYGELSVKNSKKTTTYLVSELDGSMITNGALGKLSKIKSKLSSYTAFDEYQRNFKVDLSGLIQSSEASATLNPLPVTTRTKAAAIKLNDGAVLTTWMQMPSTTFDHLGEFGFNAEHQSSNHQAIYLALDTPDGSAFAVANGYASQYAYAKALYGDDMFAHLSSDISAQTLTGLAEGGKMLSYGTRLGDQSRLAFSWSNPSAPDNFNESNRDSDTHLFKLGMQYQFNQAAFGSLTTSYLSEKSSLMGSQMSGNHGLGFSQGNKSIGLDFALGFHINENHTILLEKGFASTKAAQGDGFFVQKTSSLGAQSFGISTMSRNVFEKNDTLRISFKQPLTVTSGNAIVNTVDVDELGYPVFRNEPVDLSPSGRETRLTFAYEKNFTQHQSIKLETSLVKDAFNTDGNNDASLSLLYQLNY